MKMFITLLLILSGFCFAQKRIGIFAGTFDPFHLGHLDNILTAIDQMDLDEVVLSPLVKTPHKNPVLDFYKRWDLLNIAIKDHPKIKLYSKNLLTDLAEEGVPHQNLVNYVKNNTLRDSITYHIVGGDTFERLFSRPAIIEETLSFKNHKILILNRSGYVVDNIPRPIAHRVISLDHPGGDRGFSSSLFRKDPKSMKSLIPKNVWNNIVDNAYYFKANSFTSCEKMFLGVLN